MARYIQRRDGAEGPRYREWSTVVDQYLTPPITREQMRDKLLREAPRDGSGDAAVDERLARVDKQGNSLFNVEPEPLDGPWDTERCDKCSNFHHAFERRSDGLCRSCGEPSSCRGHLPPCVRKGGE
jgi:hypothetical protein